MSSTIRFVLVTAVYAFIFFIMPVFVFMEFHEWDRFTSASVGERVFMAVMYLPLLATMGSAALIWYIELIQPIVYPLFSRQPK